MYLIKEKPIYTIRLLVMFLISTLLIRTVGMLFEKEISIYLVLYPINLSQPLNWYRFLTYPLESVGLLGWIKIASVILPAGYLIEKRTTRKSLVTIILISMVLGGLLFTITNQGDVFNRPIASPGLISWGFWMAAITCGIINWKELKRFEKATVVLLLLGIFNLIHNDFGYFVAQIGVVVAVLTYVLASRMFKRKTVSNIV